MSSPAITVSGVEIARGRRKIIDRGIDILLVQNKDIDWNSHDLVLTVVPKPTGDTPEGVQTSL